MMKVYWLEAIEDFKHIANDWDRMVQAFPQGSPFMLSAFITTWWKYYGKGKKLRIFIIKEGESLIGGIPLYLSQKGLRNGFSHTLRYIGGVAANYTEPVYLGLSESFYLPFFESLSKRNDWDRLVLSDMRQRPQFEVPHSLNLKVVQDHYNWAINLSKGEEVYWRGLSRKLYRDLRSRQRRAVKEHGGVSLKSIWGVAEVEKIFNLYVGLSQKAFAGRKRKSAFLDDNYVNFFRDFLVYMEKNKWLDTHVLLIGSHIGAISFGYRYGNGFNWVLTGFDDEYKRFRPGYLMIKELVKMVVNRGDHTYNWYGHKQFYKSQWCNQVAPLYTAIISQQTISNYIINGIEDVVRQFSVLKKNN